MTACRGRLLGIPIYTGRAMVIPASTLGHPDHQPLIVGSLGLPGTAS
jgi:hypothetical protein